MATNSSSCDDEKVCVVRVGIIKDSPTDDEYKAICPDGELPPPECQLHVVDEEDEGADISDLIDDAEYRASDDVDDIIYIPLKISDSCKKRIEVMLQPSDYHYVVIVRLRLAYTPTYDGYGPYPNPIDYISFPWIPSLNRVLAVPDYTADRHGNIMHVFPKLHSDWIDDLTTMFTVDDVARISQQYGTQFVTEDESDMISDPPPIPWPGPNHCQMGVTSYTNLWYAFTCELCQAVDPYYYNDPYAGEKECLQNFRSGADFGSGIFNTYNQYAYTNGQVAWEDPAYNPLESYHDEWYTFTYMPAGPRMNEANNRLDFHHIRASHINDSYTGVINYGLNFPFAWGSVINIDNPLHNFSSRVYYFGNTTPITKVYKSVNVKTRPDSAYGYDRKWYKNYEVMNYHWHDPFDQHYCYVFWTLEWYHNVTQVKWSIDWSMDGGSTMDYLLENDWNPTKTWYVYHTVYIDPCYHAHPDGYLDASKVPTWWKDFDSIPVCPPEHIQEIKNIGILEGNVSLNEGPQGYGWSFYTGSYRAWVYESSYDVVPKIYNHIIPTTILRESYSSSKYNHPTGKGTDHLMVVFYNNLVQLHPLDISDDEYIVPDGAPASWSTRRESTDPKYEGWTIRKNVRRCEKHYQILAYSVGTDDTTQNIFDITDRNAELEDLCQQALDKAYETWGATVLDYTSDPIFEYGVDDQWNVLIDLTLGYKIDDNYWTL